MEVNIYRLRGVEKELNRLNDNIELLLEHVYDITPHRRRKTAPVGLNDTEVVYTNEEEDARREYLEAIGKAPKEE